MPRARYSDSDSTTDSANSSSSDQPRSRRPRSSYSDSRGQYGAERDSSSDTDDTDTVSYPCIEFSRIEADPSSHDRIPIPIRTFGNDSNETDPLPLHTPKDPLQPLLLLLMKHLHQIPLETT